MTIEREKVLFNRLRRIMRGLNTGKVTGDQFDCILARINGELEAAGKF